MLFNGRNGEDREDREDRTDGEDRDDRDDREFFIERSAPIKRQRPHQAKRPHQALAPPSTIFLVRRGYAKEDPLGIVQIVQPEGSYFMRWAENDPLSLSNYSSASFLRRKSFLRISLRIDCVRRSGSTLRVISES